MTKFDADAAFASLIDEFVEAGLRARLEAIEQACEAAVQTGVCGVLIDGDRVAVDVRVPYGHIYDASACGADNVDWGEV